MYKSEIRDSLVAGLLDRVQKNNYSKYLRSLHITNARHLKNTVINFDFPVTALIGPNGGGKSTVLALAACAHSGVSPRNFFFVSVEGDNVASVAEYEFSFIDKQVDPKGILKLSASINKEKLGNSVSSFSRPSKYFGSHRILPPSESPFFMKKRLSGRGKAAVRERKEINSEDTRKHAEKILGKSLQQFSLVEITFTRVKKIRETKSREIGAELERKDVFVHKKIVGKQLLFIGGLSNGKTFSEFNFGAGEACVLRMVAEIEQLPEAALVLIEEVENGLHPLAVARLVEYLMEVAERKRLQVIFYYA